MDNHDTDDQQLRCAACRRYGTLLLQRIEALDRGSQEPPVNDTYYECTACKRIIRYRWITGLPQADIAVMPNADDHKEWEGAGGLAAALSKIVHGAHLSRQEAAELAHGVDSFFPNDTPEYPTDRLMGTADLGSYQRIISEIDRQATVMSARGTPVAVALSPDTFTVLLDAVGIHGPEDRIERSDGYWTDKRLGHLESRVGMLEVLVSDHPDVHRHSGVLVFSRVDAQVDITQEQIDTN